MHNLCERARLTCSIGKTRGLNFVKVGPPFLSGHSLRDNIEPGERSSNAPFL